jgi:two-component system, NarL family, response regulator NreC
MLKRFEMGEIIRIFIIDGYSTVKNILKIQLEQQADMTVVGDGEVGSDTLDELIQTRPDVILMDLDTQFEGIIDMAHQMRVALINIPIIFLSVNDTERVQIAARNILGSTFVVKEGNPANLIKEIHSVS